MRFKILAGFTRGYLPDRHQRRPLTPGSECQPDACIQGGRTRSRSAQIGKRLGRRFAAIRGGSTFHAFRRTVAGTFERNRIPESEAAQIVGHGKKGITYKVYSPHGMLAAQWQFPPCPPRACR